EFERYFELENMLGLQEKTDYFHFKKAIKTPEDAEDAAKQLRREWNLGYDPIADIVKMLEDKGYKVIDLDVDEAFDGMKAVVNNQKVIVLRKAKSENEDVVRRRFTALHELAHHALIFENKKDEEKLCHAFACAVLYPEEMA